MGGSFRSLMPSDLVQVGAVARGSVPAVSADEYATQANKADLLRYFRRCVCVCVGEGVWVSE